VSYKKDTPVLKGVSLDIRPGEKIGLAGRTGSGKSTFMLSMLRILEADEGTISIDGINIASLGLDDLRGRVAIIPQEPVLFSMSLRMNVDPAERFPGFTSASLYCVCASVTVCMLTRRCRHLGGTGNGSIERIRQRVAGKVRLCFVRKWRELFCRATPDGPSFYYIMVPEC